MANRTFYRPFPSSRTSLPKYRTEYENSPGEFFNFAARGPPSWKVTQKQISKNSSPPEKSSSFSVASSRSQIKQSKKKPRITLNHQRIELLSRPKFMKNISKPSSTISKDSQIFSTEDPSILQNSSVNRFREITPRILRLAEPKIPKTNYNSQQFLGEISDKALTAKASKRIHELAEPKKLRSPRTKDPFKVNPKALKATCTSRTEELARPKNAPSPFAHILQSYVDRVFIPPN